MLIREFDKQVQGILQERVLDLEKCFEGDCVFIYGPIYPLMEKRFRDFIEGLGVDGSRRGRLVVFLSTDGGSAETVEKLVEIIRFHYAEVFFVVPDAAMSAGTIFCMAGDKIHMDYTSSLGPIDPQVWNGKDWVPALGYLDQVERMIKRTGKGALGEGPLTEAELVILQNQDLAMLSRYEQAKQLTITLLKKWLVQYKFKDWTHHQSNPEKIGQIVTEEEKQARAEEIAANLSNNQLWHSHGRMIGIATLTSLLKLKIEDYSNNTELRGKIRAYTDFLTEYVNRHDIPSFLHSRSYF